MKNNVTILLLLIIIFNLSFSQETITINQGTPVIVDGTISPGEWDDAQFVNLQSSGNKIVRILYKNDSENFLFAFTDNLGSANFRYPEIFFDINYDKSPSWMNDDWWFHVSSTNCYNRGAHSVYNANTCKTVQPTWQANNFNVSLPDTVEIKIPFTTVELDTNHTIGIAFDVTNTYSAWEFYPADANINSPETWITANVYYNVIGVEDNNDIHISIRIYPNPFSNSATIHYFLKKTSKVQIVITDLLGNNIQTVVNETQGSGDYLLNYETDNLSNGVCFYKFIVDDNIYNSGIINVIK